MDASEIHAWRLNAKEVSTLQNGETFVFPIVDGTVKLSRGDQVLRTSTLFRDRPERGEEQGNFLRESDGSCSTPRQDSSWYDGEAKNDFWSISGKFIFCHHVEPRVKLYVPREVSFSFSTEIHRRDQGYKNSIGCSAGENIEDYWNVDGDRELSDTWTGFTQDSLYWTKNHRMDVPGPWRDGQESKRPPDQTLCGQKFGKICQKRRSEKKNKSGPSKNRS